MKKNIILFIVAGAMFMESVDTTILNTVAAAVIISFFAYNPNTAHTLTVQNFHNTFLAICVLTLLSITVFVQLKKEDGQELINKLLV